MSLVHLLSSSIGKKLLVAVTGICLVFFLIVHCYVNMNLLFDNAEENFNKAAHFMGTNILVRISEVGLFLGFILHIYQGLVLHFQNQSKRTKKYAVSPGNKSSKWYARSMGLFGTIILLFLLVHLYNFWVPSRFTDLTEKEYNGIKLPNLYAVMQDVFSNKILVILYVIGCISLGWHLFHGIQGAFRTFGVTRKLYIDCIYRIGAVYAIVVPFLFILMPLFMYFRITIDLGSLTFFF